MFIFISTHDSTALLHNSLFMRTSPSSSFTPQPCRRHSNLKCCTEDLVYICKNLSSILTGGICGVITPILPSYLGHIAL